MAEETQVKGEPAVSRPGGDASSSPEPGASKATAPPRRISPVKLAHIALRTSRFEDMKTWYSTVLNARIGYADPMVAFMTYDSEHHRLAIVHKSDLESNSQWNAGLEHIGFTYASLGDLLENFERLAALWIRPFWCVNHGTTTSMYYLDPDDNQVELQVENFDSYEALRGWFKSGAFSKNPIGVNFEPDELLERYRAGVPVELLLRPWEAQP